jgi:methionine synthase / methylenetetrahydrofolate reductase(NADPH)
MAQYSRRFLEAGAKIVGGCCGTTPAHINEIRD